ncbi:hypothetical protein HY345_03930 [Candidatus Microgenomates bacterium]|nr:hypothetical protein [Candidatus Microgenomates bacterium]
MKKLLKKVIPLWLVLAIVLDTSLLVGLGEYYLLTRQFNSALSKLSQTTKNPEEFIQILKQEVVPYKGYKTLVKWNDLGKQLVESGAIDKQKFEELFAQDVNVKDHLKYLEGNSNHNMVINENNSRFMVNTLWALGLVNKSKVLDEGLMKQEGLEVARLASTGGWTLGTKGPMELYSSQEIIKLTSEQQDLVKKIAENVYRPCCGNSTAFPDCNHGMAALGYIQLAVKAGLSEKQIYQDLLAFNSYWFPQHYVEMAAMFSKQNVKWKDVDPKIALSQEYSSALAASRIQQQVQDIPGFESKGGSCGA